MGLFGSKTVTTVGTSVSRVISDDLLPNSTRTGVLKSIINQGELTDYVMEELVNSVAVRADRMYAYAKDNYTYGLPSGQRVTTNQGATAVKAVLSLIEGSTVTIDYSHIACPNDLHIGWMTLVNQYGYDNETNQLDVLSAQKETPVYLKDMVVIVPESMVATIIPGALNQWGAPARAGVTPDRADTSAVLGTLLQASPVYSDPNATTDYVKVTYVWQVIENGVKVTKEESFSISVEAYNDVASYFHVRYFVGSKAKYWMYLIGSGTYPTLDAVTATEHSTSGTYFPFAYLRYNKVNQADDTSTDGYKTSKKMVKYLGMDFDTVADAINENPDIGDVEQAMVMLAVPANTENETERRYLFEFFDELYKEEEDKLSVPTIASISAALSTNSVTSVTTETSIVIQDKRFKMALTNQGIYKRTVGGSIGDVDTHDSGYTVDNIDTGYVNAEDGVTYSQLTPIKTHYYRKQVTESLYEEIRVVGLKMVYWVYGDYTTTGDDEDDILMIPVDRSITETYSIPDREVLYARSLHYIFNSRVVTKLKWYQTGLFQVIVLIIAIIITVVTEGADGGSAIGAALGVSGVTELIAIIVVNYIIGQLIAAGFKLFVQAFGTKIASIVAVIAILYGGYQIMESGSVAGAPFASDLLQVSTGLSKAIIESKMSDLLGEAKAFEDYAEAQNKLLEDAQELLEGKSNLSPFVIFGESPEDFFNRTIHYGNIGTLGFDAIQSFADIALTLPTIDETLGGNA